MSVFKNARSSSRTHRKIVLVRSSVLWWENSWNGLNNKENMLACMTEVESASGEPCFSSSNDSTIWPGYSRCSALENVTPVPCLWPSFVGKQISAGCPDLTLLHYIVCEHERQRCYRKKQSKTSLWVLNLVEVCISLIHWFPEAIKSEMDWKS